ncbi:MAG: sulfatase-like hydrolase/transferase [Planctomycetota bacterium]
MTAIHKFRRFVVAILLVIFSLVDANCLAETKRAPNILFILTDDHRHDCLSSTGNPLVRTPNLDRIAARGTRFRNAFVTLAICSPSRAACLSGQCGSVNGVTSVGKVRLDNPSQTFATTLQSRGYSTGVTGKWHLSTTPAEAGFEFASVCWSNGTWYDRTFEIGGTKKTMPGFVDDVTASESIRFVRQAVAEEKPFVLWMNTQVPHMDHRHTWPAQQRYLDEYDTTSMPVPTSWSDPLTGKPDYLKAARNRTQALKYGYDDPKQIQKHTRDYYASVEQMDAAVGRVFDELDRLNIRDETWIVMMGDNGWFLGEHGMTSKVLPYEESMRVPLVIAGPNTQSIVTDVLALNIDVTATILELAGVRVPASMHGRSLLPITDGKVPANWRTSFIYEAPTPQLGSRPLWAIRDADWKYIRTRVAKGESFEELYDLRADSGELENLIDEPQHDAIVKRLRKDLDVQLTAISVPANADDPSFQTESSRSAPQGSAVTRQLPRTDLFISGVYPHLTTYGVYSQNGAHLKSGHNECGIGAIVPWAGKLWMVNYAPHMPRGSEHKLFSVDPDLTKQMTVHPESVGGTPAGRMIHAESKQLLIGHHLIDSKGNVRTIQPTTMPIRVTAIARHLKDPANKVYYVDMEGSIWEANVHDLSVTRLFKKPVPGWHGKGGYTSQGRLVVSNNGELHVGDYKEVLVGGESKNPEERGVLAEWDGDDWRIIERRQFTEVTGPDGVVGGSDDDAPIWSMGWDRRSVRLKLLEDGTWHTYLLPKASYCNDASHGWYTEWPRIREITEGRWMMDMHGMFFDFPRTFSSTNSKGILPIGSHLRYVPDFCEWDGRLVLATDETSIQGNPLAGQPQSNLWFGTYEELKEWGPTSGYGGPWLDDQVEKETWSDPFLVAGFTSRTLHLAVGRTKPPTTDLLRTSDQQSIHAIPEKLAVLPMVTINRGDWHKPAPEFSFEVDQPVTVFLAVDQRGEPSLDSQWIPTEMELRWGKGHRDRVFRRQFPAGLVTIPGNATQHSKGSFGMPHMAFVSSAASDLVIQPNAAASLRLPRTEPTRAGNEAVVVSVQVDSTGTNQWTDLSDYQLHSGEATSVILPDGLDAVWMRFKVDRDCVATAFLHQTSASPNPKPDTGLFAGVADVADKATLSGLIYAAKRNRNLRVVANDGRYFEFSKNDFRFKADDADAKLTKLLEVEPEFQVDDASVLIESQGRRFRLPKGDAAFDKPFSFGWPRAVREVESERHLANIHGTFYELPLVTNGAPPAWNLIRPVSSHRKQIADYCSWNGLLVLAGIKPNATNDGHVFRDPNLETGLWFGGVDDLWKLGKPVGRGGPWADTTVKAGLPSDPFLMRGYDDKQVTLSHQSEESVELALEVDIDGNGRWIPYKTFSVPSGERLNHRFPSGFSACWVRVIADTDTTATCQLEYR